MWGEPLKGPQNTQILTVMRDSGSFRGQQQQMIFTKAKRSGGKSSRGVQGWGGGVLKVLPSM